jgi:hypothetical protein
MFTIKRFKDGVDIYHVDWRSHLPKTMTIIQRGKKVTFVLGNVMKHFDMVQVTYESNVWGFASTLEFDFYFLKIFNQDNFKIDVDITVGDAMACEFSLKAPNKVDVIEYTSWRSQTDPSNTLFALDDESLKEFVGFLNLFTGFNLNVSDFKFLDKYDDYNPK